MGREMSMAAVPLWFVGTQNGDVTHGEGFPLPQKSGRAKYWLTERGGGDWDLVNGTAGSYRVAFDNAEDAARYLESWCKNHRQLLGEAYRAAQMLTVEMTPKLKG